jgi:hypothetical protein
MDIGLVFVVAPFAIVLALVIGAEIKHRIYKRRAAEVMAESEEGSEP